MGYGKDGFAGSYGWIRTLEREQKWNKTTGKQKNSSAVLASRELSVCKSQKIAIWILNQKFLLNNVILAISVVIDGQITEEFYAEI